MKTRIIYPKNIWFDKTLNALSAEAKVLAFFLISNANIGLTRIYQQRDLEIMFVLGIKSEEKLQRLKDELQDAGLFYFFDEWVFINNDYSYCDYSGRDRVIRAKNEELAKIPQEVKDYFNGLKRGYKQVNKGLRTPYKSKTINNKSKTINTNNNELKEKAKKVLAIYNRIFNKKLTSTASIEANLDFWLKEGYTLADIELALQNARLDGFWRDKMTPVILLRRKNPQGEPVDWIGTLKDRKPRGDYQKVSKYEGI